MKANMTKLQISVLALMFFSFRLAAQENSHLYIKGIDKDSAVIVKQAGLQTVFASKAALTQYISKLPGLLHAKGFITSSIDSTRYDSTYARIVLYAGEQFKWATIDAGKIEPGILEATGWREKNFRDRTIDFNEVSIWQNRILDYLENNGYPFAKVWLDSIRILPAAGEQAAVVSAMLLVDKGPLYKIDSIRLYGDAKISNNFLQRYFELPNG